jgi:LuxR family maltose regulon positive regulatory protein
MAIRQITLAKTTRPSYLSGVLPRERLFALLDNARAMPSIWITGSPGSGKTTLAASYIERAKLPSLWYQIDDSDNDVASFFYHLGLAAGEHARRKKILLPPLTPQSQSNLPVFARRYFQALFLALGDKFIIAFDGYHELPPQSLLHDILLIAITEAPPGGTVMIISRSEPPPSMARLRANQRMAVVGWRDLQLTQKESNAIAQSRGHELSANAMTGLYEKTQGWAAGLILLLEQTPAPGAIPSLPDLSAPQLVFDYLAGEIFQKTDAATQELLLKTSYLPQMTADMACAVSGLTDAGERLNGMHRNNYFVALKQGHPQAVYEYHPLFREFALARANATFSKDQRHHLQLASAELLEANGLTAEAVLLLRAAGGWKPMEAVIRRHARDMLDSGRSETLAQWVEALPRDVQEKNPWTLYWLALARVHVSPRESRLLQERAHKLFSMQSNVDARGLVFTCSGAMDAILYEVDDFSLLDRWISIMDKLLRDQPALVSGALEARIACSLFTSMVIRQPHHPQIEYWADRAYHASAAQTDLNLRLSVEPRIALGIAYGGHFPKAAAVLEGVRRIVAREEVRPADLAMFHLVEATFFMLTAQRQPCYDAVQRGLEIERTEGVTIMSHQLLAYGAGGALAVGDLDTSEKMLRAFDALPHTNARFDLCLYHLFSTWLALRKHDAVLAFQQQKLALKTAIEVGCPVFEALCRMAAAHVQYRGNDVRGALASFQHVYDIARPIRNHLLEFTGLMCYAYVALDSGRRPRSGMRALRQALEVAKPRSYLSHLLWLPESLSWLCSIALESSIETDFVSQLIHQRKLTIDALATPVLDWPWPVRVHTLGKFRVIRDGNPIAFSGKAQKRPFDLLKAIIAHGSRDVPEERITQSLWPRIDGDSAHRSFATTLHRLRKLLGEERAITLSEGKVSLDGRYIWVDTWALEHHIERITQVLRLPPVGTDAAQIAEAGDLILHQYQGSFLDNEAEEAWALPMRERLRRRFLRAVSDLQRYWQQAAQPERAIELLERALELDSTAESLYRNLMTCYADQGRRADAAETYRRCEKILRANLNVAPSAETSALHERLVSLP